MLTDEQIDKFRRLYNERFGVEIDRDRAIELGTRLVNMMRVVYRPVVADKIELDNKT